MWSESGKKCLELVKHSYKTSYSTAKEYTSKYIFKIKPIIITENNYNIFYNPEWKYWLKVMYSWISDQWSVLSRKKEREKGERDIREIKKESPQKHKYLHYVWEVVKDWIQKEGENELRRNSEMYEETVSKCR